MRKTCVKKSMRELITRASTELPEDIRQALEGAHAREKHGSVAAETLEIIRDNHMLAAADRLPICQDTGTILAIIKAKPCREIFVIEEALRQSVAELTAEGILRQNCVDSLTERNTGNNLGSHAPQIHVIPAQGPTEVAFMLKGGGSENMSTQYSLPHAGLAAGRDFEGVRRCVLDAVYQAQGKGCAPGILGVCIGGDRALGFSLAKEQLFHKLTRPNPEKRLAALEEQILREANTLDIGPMGLGGKTTLLGVKIACAERHPACYFVTVSYSCWATRRYRVQLDERGRIETWL